MKITVITAVYNNRASISEAIESVLGQTYPNVETVVIDGGSSDGTLKLLHGYGTRLGLVVSEPDNGIYDALNKGIERATGDVIGFLHSDDVLADADVLAKIAEAFADPLVDAVYGDLLYVGKDDPAQIVRYWRAGKFSRDKLSRGWMPPHPTLYVRKSVYARVGTFDMRYNIAADYDWILRFLSQDGVRCKYIPEPLVKMRLGGVSNRSLKLMMKKSVEDLRALRENHVGGLGALLMKNFRKLPQFVTRPENIESA